ncbi:GntR family transcriptional regulator [Thalassospira lucentensis]|uniref:GntR family transcriptional regulator n=1 Tax=Thalassospira lucentensis TaxID=168935 RepID=UPI00294320C3|nr:GntR family transcriptional regulator [Thalassospira lucentensis]WOI11149.1 GntR family transcriptional regulator [Thalassospira lucentensis]
MTASPRFTRRTITDQVTEDLRARILSGDFPAGFQLRQDAIATEYNVSRIPVREALQRLDAEGLVSFQPHKGAIVAHLSLDEIEELFEVRKMLECELLRHAVPRLTPEDIKSVEDILAVYDESFRSGDISKWGELNREFHDRLYRASNRPKTLEIIRMIGNNTVRFTQAQLALSGATDRAEREHHHILDACKARDVDYAVELLEAHIENSKNSLIECLRGARASEGAPS